MSGVSAGASTPDAHELVCSMCHILNENHSQFNMGLALAGGWEQALPKAGPAGLGRWRLAACSCRVRNRRQAWVWSVAMGLG